MVSVVTLFLAALLAALLAIISRVTRKNFPSGQGCEGDESLPNAPGPKPWPIIGSLHLLGQYEVPFEALTALAKMYGDIYSITLGSTPCVVVNSFQLIKEVLISKGAHFGDRPDFIRFHKLFGGDRNNSLALCDWSDLQKTRRSIARMYCSPRPNSDHHGNLGIVGCAEVKEFLRELSTMSGPQGCNVKPLIQAACANMFTQYMCSKRFAYDDKDFVKVVRTFDEIFWEINQGYAVDFLPWLQPVYQGHLRKISQWAYDIRQFILSRIIDEHWETINMEGEPRDFTDALLKQLKKGGTGTNMNLQHIIFELEDFLGGHSAIGNLVMLSLAAVVRHPRVAKKIQTEVDAVTSGSRNVTLSDKNHMPYTEATLLETLRTASSPIVPHVASQDTSIAGYFVQKGTMVFLNNYELNTAEQYWSDPMEFKPERFISAEGQVTKPEHFIPFSTGKRTCIGQKLVQGFAFILLASILQHYDVGVSEGTTIRTYPACVAVPPDTFSLSFTPRCTK